jgi:hypothetical protein
LVHSLEVGPCRTLQELRIRLLGTSDEVLIQEGTNFLPLKTGITMSVVMVGVLSTTKPS